jgi:hypothetical protein
MRFLGSVLMALGILVGLALGVFILLGGGSFGFTWLVSVAIAKLTFLSSVALLGAGAVFHRIDRRRQNSLMTSSKL